MATTIQLWEIEKEQPSQLAMSPLVSEAELENWLVKNPELLGTNLMLIGKQVQTDYGTRIDLLAMDDEANLILIEVKRDRTPREVVAQSLDYATWVHDLEYEVIDKQCQSFRGTNLVDSFQSHFDQALPETINTEHGILIVAAELDESSERIVTYLSEQWGVNINVVLFQPYVINGKRVLAQASLLDPQEVQERAPSKKKVPWKGYYFVNVGESKNRNWDDCKQYGFISAGQSSWASNFLKKLQVGDTIFAYMKGLGYVGHGKITSTSCMIKDFVVDGKPLLEQELKAEEPENHADDTDRSEWVVGVDWVDTKDRKEAIWFQGGFANQSIVCKLRQPATVKFLEKEFGLDR